MVEFWWLWVAAGGGLAVGMFLFALMTMASAEPHAETGVAQVNDLLT
jgi:hypothetical protein